MIVKICGVRTVEAAEAAAASGADVVGMIFAPSPRLIDIATAQEIAEAIVHTTRNAAISVGSSTSAEGAYFKTQMQQVFGKGRKRPQLCGVFQNQPVEHILDVVSRVPLDLVQLHGNEPVELARQIPVPVIKVFHIDDGFDIDQAGELLQTDCHSIILLDTKVAGQQQQGGRGVSFDWTIARKLADRGVPFLMAGGLTPDNVQEAVQVGAPWGVDVSSGVETDKVKDKAKMMAFVDGARGGKREI
ncbi:anthranilate synthase / indole-3-glycerol phosphate synthase [Coemansia sp. RSA 990]|nr:phosphoribosylanthranilate isomerase [Coemansia mojavensis]KAJ1742088.1 anthranilate synthase / indole-3-glycerol phosphate synthase [Coemansia sp. RSA 1086]KAJ1873405.1 anthranilate synthase / indole-3-glycerol phosphate synthase [Coemansia sp. RSA 990]